MPKSLARNLLTALICFTLLLPLPCYSEQKETLTLDQALGIALQNNTDLKAMEARLGVSEAQIVTAAARLNPWLLSDNGIAEKSYRLGIQQTFQLGGKRAKRIQVAQASRDSVSHDIQATVVQVRSRVRQAYTNLYYAQARYWTYEEISKTAKQLVDIAFKREQAGAISELDVMQTQIQLLNAKNELLGEQGRVTTARNELNILLNQPLDTSIVLAPPPLFPDVQGGPSVGVPKQAPPLLQLDSLIEKALQTRPEIKKNLADLNMNRKQLALAKANRIPDMVLTAGPDLNIGQTAPLSAFIIGTVELPVVNRQQGPLQEVKATQLQLEREQAALKNQIKLEVSNAFNQLMTSQMRVISFDTELIPLSAKIYNRSVYSFNAGKSQVTFPVLAQQAYATTRLNQLEALKSLQDAINSLERAIGLGL